jgi:hypothetical protein
VRAHPPVHVKPEGEPMPPLLIRFPTNRPAGRDSQVPQLLGRRWKVQGQDVTKNLDSSEYNKLVARYISLRTLLFVLSRSAIGVIFILSQFWWGWRVDSTGDPITSSTIHIKFYKASCFIPSLGPN